MEPSAATTPSAQKKSPLIPIAGLILLIAAGGAAAWYFVGRSAHDTTPIPIQPVPTPTAATVAQTTASAAPSVTPAATNTATTASSPNEFGREHTFTGKVGAKEATFRLRFEPSGHVTGTYTQDGSTYRLEGRHPKGKMFLDEFTGERVTARIEVSLVESATVVRWEGTMRNTPPDNRVLPIYFERTPPAMSLSPAAAPPDNTTTTGDFTYEGTVGPYQASFQLRFEANGRVTGSYTLATNRNLVLRLEGRNPKGKLVLDEYTRDRLTARLELNLNDAANDICWEGTMRNTPPDNRVFPVSFSRPRN